MSLVAEAISILSSGTTILNALMVASGGLSPADSQQWYNVSKSFYGCLWLLKSISIF